VNKKEYKVHIRCFVVGDLAFEQKYLQRGGGSGKTGAGSVVRQALFTMSRQESRYVCATTFAHPIF
jgi:hypothetical protein